MHLIELPRALEDYFAFAETEPTRRGRRFSITLAYRQCDGQGDGQGNGQGDRLERLQWWYHVSPAQERMYEGHGIAILREQAIERFRCHIGRWLEITRQRLHAEDPIPRVSSQHSASLAAALTPTNAPVATTPAEIPSWPEKLRA